MMGSFKLDMVKRLSVLEEIIALFEGYIEVKPEHTEYYNSVLSHHYEIRRIWSNKLMLLEASTCLPN
jgi:hypothetical protein